MVVTSNHTPASQGFNFLLQPHRVYGLCNRQLAGSRTFRTIHKIGNAKLLGEKDLQHGKLFSVTFLAPLFLEFCYAAHYFESPKSFISLAQNKMHSFILGVVLVS